MRNLTISIIFSLLYPCRVTFEWVLVFSSCSLSIYIWRRRLISWIFICVFVYTFWCFCQCYKMRPSPRLIEIEILHSLVRPVSSRFPLHPFRARRRSVKWKALKEHARRVAPQWTILGHCGVCACRVYTNKYATDKHISGKSNFFATAAFIWNGKRERRRGDKNK